MKKALIISAEGLVSQHLIEYLKSLRIYSIAAVKISNNNLEFSDIEAFDLDIFWTKKRFSSS